MPNLNIAVTVDNLTADMIRQAADRWPHMLGSERSATALGQPLGHTAGGLPLYPPAREIYHAREYVARLINTCWNEGSQEHGDLGDAVTNHPQDAAERRLASELLAGE